MPEQTLESVLLALASERWMLLRTKHNRNFMCYGPGDSWERYKTLHHREFEEIQILRDFLNLPEEQSTIARRQQCR